MRVLGARNFGRDRGVHTTECRLAIGGRHIQGRARYVREGSIHRALSTIDAGRDGVRRNRY